MLTREDRIEIVDDLFARMEERGMLLTRDTLTDAVKEAADINVTCEGGTIECSHGDGLTEDDVRRAVSDVTGDMIEQITTGVFEHLSRYAFILRPSAEKAAAGNNANGFGG